MGTGRAGACLTCCLWMAAFLLTAERAPAQVPPCLGPPSPVATQFADVTGDGKADAIVVNYSGITMLTQRRTTSALLRTVSDLESGPNHFGGARTRCVSKTRRCSTKLAPTATRNAKTKRATSRLVMSFLSAQIVNFLNSTFLRSWADHRDGPSGK